MNHNAGLLAYATEEQDPSIWGAGPYYIAAVNEWQYVQIPLLRQRFPGIKVFCYANAASTRPSQPAPAYPAPHSGTDASGVSLEFGLNFYPGWFWYDTAGNPIKFPDYNVYATDIGDPAYRWYWATQTAAIVKAKGFDGVWFDDVNTVVGHGSLGSLIGVSDDTYGNDMVGFMQHVVPVIGSKGLAVIANVAVNPWDSVQNLRAMKIADVIAQHTPKKYRNYAGINREFFSGWSNEGNLDSWKAYTTGERDSVIAYLQAVIAKGINAFGIDYGRLSDTARKNGGLDMFAQVTGNSVGGAYFYAQY